MPYAIWAAVNEEQMYVQANYGKIKEARGGGAFNQTR